MAAGEATAGLLLGDGEGKDRHAGQIPASSSRKKEGRLKKGGGSALRPAVAEEALLRRIHMQAAGVGGADQKKKGSHRPLTTSGETTLLNTQLREFKMFCDGR